MEVVREQRLARTLRAVAAAHPYYRQRLRGLADIRSLDDLQALPLTDKSDYTADPDAFRLRADDLPDDFAPEERVLWDIAYTTGTTSGKPSPFYNTTHDTYAIMDQARRCNEAEGLNAGDRVANLYPLANFPTGAFLSVVRSTMVMGLPAVHGLTGTANSEFKVRHSLSEAIDKVERLRPTVLWGVPSFVRRFVDEARQQGRDFRDVRMVITSGEPMPQTLRQELRAQLAAMGAAEVTIRARYACTEMQGGLVQCAEGAHVQNICPDLYFLEAVDPATGRRMPDGEEGMLALTHLHRRGTVLLRYLVGDLVTLSHERCPHCGRIGERVVATPRRTGNLVKCRGMLVNTDLIAEALQATEGVAAFQVVFRREDKPGAMDELVVQIERSQTGAARLTDAELTDDIARRVRAAVSVRPVVAIVATGALYDHERSIKARRVIDMRPRAE